MGGGRLGRGVTEGSRVAVAVPALVGLGAGVPLDGRVGLGARLDARVGGMGGGGSVADGARVGGAGEVGALQAASTTSNRISAHRLGMVTLLIIITDEIIGDVEENAVILLFDAIVNTQRLLIHPPRLRVDLLG